MPRSYQDIIDQAEQLSRTFEEDFEPAETPEVAALRAASFRRAQAEADLLVAVEHAISAGEPWRTIGAAVGTTGEAARQRYGKLPSVKGRVKKARRDRTAGTAGTAAERDKETKRSRRNA